MNVRKLPRATYQSMSRGELIEALMTAHAEPSANNAKLLEAIEADRLSLVERLRESKARAERAEMAQKYRDDLFRNGPLAYCVLDRNAVVERANIAASTLFCTSEKVLVGAQLTHLVAAEKRQAFLDHLARCMGEGIRIISELPIHVRDRGEIIVEVVSTPRIGPEGWPDACRTVFHDVTRQRRQAALPEFLVRLHDELVACNDVDATSAAIARTCVPVLGEAVFVDVVSAGHLRRAGLSVAAPHASLRDGILGQAKDESWCRYAERITHSRRGLFEPASAAGFPTAADVSAVALIPLVGQDGILGILGALRFGGGVHTLETIELADEVARHATRALEKARLTQQVSHCECCNEGRALEHSA